FKLDTTDVRKRTNVATSEAQRQRERTREWGGEGSVSATRKSDASSSNEGDEGKSSWSGSSSQDYKQSWYSKGTGKDTASFKMTTVSSSSDEATINMHAQLGGKVKVNFKSDYFPMEKMVDIFQVNQIQEKVKAGIAPSSQTPPPPPPPLPPLPS